jgi:hypothetical protein
MRPHARDFMLSPVLSPYVNQGQPAQGFESLKGSASQRRAPFGLGLSCSD